MAKLVHEIWEEDGPHGRVPTLCFAGPDGENLRKLLKNARLVKTFEAESNFEAMTIFYQHNGWGEYALNHRPDKDPYPDSWAERQGSKSVRPDPGGDHGPGSSA